MEVGTQMEVVSCPRVPTSIPISYLSIPTSIPISYLRKSCVNRRRSRLQSTCNLEQPAKQQMDEDFKKLKMYKKAYSVSGIISSVCIWFTVFMHPTVNTSWILLSFGRKMAEGEGIFYLLYVSEIIRLEPRFQQPYGKMLHRRVYPYGCTYGVH